MKNCLLKLIDKILLRKRAIIKSVNDQLNNISQLEHGCWACRSIKTSQLFQFPC